MNVSIGDVYLEVVDNAVILTLPSKYTLKIEQAKYDKDIFMSDDLNRYAKHLHNNGGVNTTTHSFSYLGSQIASVESMTSQFY